MSDPNPSSKNRCLHEGTVTSRTPFSPEKILLGPGTEVITDITDKSITVGLISAEGYSGFLLATERSQAQFLEMPPGTFSAEHAHPFGFIIYTVKGRWVVCSNEKRCVMDPGSICVCRANVPMGMEVPFNQGAFMLFFLEGGIESERRYENYLKGVSQGTIIHEQKAPVLLNDLPNSHPARLFAEKVNPGFIK